jgi:uncharacterized RDD family membrane protein YckC
MVQSPAGFWIRLAARLLDGLILGAAIGLLSLLLGLDISRGRNPFGILEILYFIIVPLAWFGYTIGKKICSIRIVKVDGSKLGVGAMILREFVGALIYGFTLGIAAIVSAFMVGLREDKRSIHDLIAGTYVTHEPPDEG